jgi:Tol biopolymer transport system component
MLRVIRRGLAAVLATLLMAPAAAAALPAPQLAVIEVSLKPSRAQLSVIGAAGRGRATVVKSGPRSRLSSLSSLAWSTDGERIAFSGVVGVKPGDDHDPILRMFSVRADGSGLERIRGADEASGPVFSPDGRTLAFTRSVDREESTTVGGRRWKDGFHGSSVWTVDLDSGRQHLLTPWRDGVSFAASSYSPDGATLLATHDDDRLLREPEPVALDVDDGSFRHLFGDGGSPVYSPDGSKIAFVRLTSESADSPGESSDLYVIDTDGGGARRITRSPDIEVAPSWDPSGERLAYQRISVVGSADEGIGFTFALMEINADGSCPTTVKPRPRTALLAPAWRPGPGREAGRIDC